MKSLAIVTAAALIALTAPAYAGGADNGKLGGWRNGERNGTTKNRDWPGETNGFVRQDLRALENEDPYDDIDEFGNLVNTLEGYATRDAYRGLAGNSGKEPGSHSQRENGLPKDLQY